VFLNYIVKVQSVFMRVQHCLPLLRHY